MDYSIWAILLLAVGLVLIVAEVFIPSGGIILVSAIGSLLGAILCAWMAWWPAHPGYFWGFLVGMFLTLPTAVVVAFHYWPSTPIGRRAILEAPTPHEVDGFGDQQRRNSQLVGKRGETVTILNPAGIALIDGARVHCQSEGMIIGPGVSVRVVGARMNTVIVREGVPTDSNLSEFVEDAAGGTDLPSASNPLDFEMN